MNSEVKALRKRINRLREGLREMAHGFTSNSLESDYGFMADSKTLLEDDDKARKEMKRQTLLRKNANDK